MPRRFKQCLGFYQVATRVPDVYVVTLPKSARRVLSIFEVFNINIGGLSLPLSCVALGKYWQQMLFTILFPIVIAACIFFCSSCKVESARSTLESSDQI